MMRRRSRGRGSGHTGGTATIETCNYFSGGWPVLPSSETKMHHVLDGQPHEHTDRLVFREHKQAEV